MFPAMRLHGNRLPPYFRRVLDDLQENLELVVTFIRNTGSKMRAVRYVIRNSDGRLSMATPEGLVLGRADVYAQISTAPGRFSTFTIRPMRSISNGGAVGEAQPNVIPDEVRILLKTLSSEWEIEIQYAGTAGTHSIVLRKMDADARWLAFIEDANGRLFWRVVSDPYRTLVEHPGRFVDYKIVPRRSRAPESDLNALMRNYVEDTPADERRLRLPESGEDRLSPISYEEVPLARGLYIPENMARNGTITALYSPEEMATHVVEYERKWSPKSKVPITKLRRLPPYLYA
jgi:hypothetical protein